MDNINKSQPDLLTDCGIISSDSTVETISSEDKEIFPIMDLPQELRGHIFNYFPQNQLLPIRLTCKQWNLEIIEYYNFNGIINDELDNWDKIFQLRLKSCKIIHFLKHLPIYNNLPGTKIFKYPQLLQKLNLNTIHITFDNLYYILSDYGLYLKELVLLLSLPILIKNDYKLASFSTFNFSKLIKLELIVSTIIGENIIENRLLGPTNSMNAVLQEKIFSELMQNTSMISLQYLKLELHVMGVRIISRFLSRIFNFLSIYNNSGSASGNSGLKVLDFELIQGHHGLPSTFNQSQSLNDTDMELLDLNKLYQLKSLNSLRVISSSTIGVDIWLEFMCKQLQLQLFEVDILPALQSKFITIISNNFETLVQLEINDLTIWYQNNDNNDDDNDNEDNNELIPRPFDLSILQPCKSLKKLVLDRNVLARRRFETVELINLIFLPNSLVELALNYFNILTNDFYLYFSSLLVQEQEQQRETNLRNLTITQCGNNGDFGINGSTLEILLMIESIIFIEISIFNFGINENDEERIKLNRILVNYGYNENHSYFQCSKIPTMTVSTAIGLITGDNDNDNENVDELE